MFLSHCACNDQRLLEIFCPIFLHLFLTVSGSLCKKISISYYSKKMFSVILYCYYR